MGIQDRDYYKNRNSDKVKDAYYDPKQFRGGRSQAPTPLAKVSPKSSIKYIAIWLVIAWVLMTIFSKYPPDSLKKRAHTTPAVPTTAAQPPAEVIDGISLALQQTREGHYFSSGTVNGFPVVFLVDTGATTVSISQTVASRAGIPSCTPRLVSTANGTTKACATTVPEISFGKFRITNVEVNIMPNMSEDALLGMNVLRNFRIEQTEGTMRISI